VTATAKDSVETLLKTGVNNLHDINNSLTALGFPQFQINLAIKSLIDEGYDVYEKNKQHFLVMV